MHSPYDVLCFSHLRWDHVYQRPQHLLSRCARDRRVFFIEEPLFDSRQPRLTVMSRGPNLWLVIPRLPPDCSADDTLMMMRALLDQLLLEEDIRRHLQWFYTPIALPWADHLHPVARIYDCMDELGVLTGAPPEFTARERALLCCADLVFTAGHSLYEAKCDQNPHVHLFTSGIDRAHFGRAREPLAEPQDQAGIARPRLGYYGVIDERLDRDLLAAIADARPYWQFVMLGPVLRIDPQDLPRRPNLHWLGARTYAELPAYLAGWDAALLPFVRSERTRFIPPTKIVEYLAAGKPVVSTSLRDVVRPYGELGLVGIADTPETFVAAVEHQLRRSDDHWLADVDMLLRSCAWDDIWQRMRTLIHDVVRPRVRPTAMPTQTAHAD